MTFKLLNLEIVDLYFVHRFIVSDFVVYIRSIYVVSIFSWSGPDRVRITDSFNWFDSARAACHFWC